MIHDLMGGPFGLYPNLRLYICTGSIYIDDYIQDHRNSFDNSD